MGNNAVSCSIKSKACTIMYIEVSKNNIIFQLEKILEVYTLNHDKNLFLSLHDQIIQQNVEVRSVSWACDLHVKEPCAWLNICCLCLETFYNFLHNFLHSVFSVCIWSHKLRSQVYICRSILNIKIFFLQLVFAIFEICINPMTVRELILI